MWIQKFVFKKMHMKIPSAKRRPSLLDLNVWSFKSIAISHTRDESRCTCKFISSASKTISSPPCIGGLRLSKWNYISGFITCARSDCVQLSKTWYAFAFLFCAFLLHRYLYSIRSYCWMLLFIPALDTRTRFYSHGLTLIPPWVSNHMHSNVLDEITYLFPKFNDATVEVI